MLKIFALVFIILMLNIIHKYYSQWTESQYFCMFLFIANHSCIYVTFDDFENMTIDKGDIGKSLGGDWTENNYASCFFRKLSLFEIAIWFVMNHDESWTHDLRFKIWNLSAGLANASWDQ